MKPLKLPKFKKKGYITALSIKNRLLVAFLAILLIPTTCLGLSSYLTSKNAIDDQIMNNTKQSVEAVNQQLTQLINTSFEDLEYLSKTVNGSMVTGDASPKLRAILDPIKAVKAEYDHVQFATLDGKLLNSPQQTFAEGFDVRERAWYSNALGQKGTAFVNGPIISQDGKVIVVPSLSAKDGSGVVSVVLSLTDLSNTVNAIKVGENGYVTILASNHQYLTHPTIAPGTENTEAYMAELDTNATGTIDFTSEGIAKKALYTTNELTGWKIIGVIDTDEIASASRGILTTTIVVLIVAVIVGLLLAMWIITSINNPLKRLVQATERVAEGDLTEEVKITSNDELGRLSASVNKMIVSLRDLISQVGFHSEQVAATSEELSANAEQTSTTSEHISGAVQEIALGSEKQVHNAEAFSTATNEISAGMRQASESIQNVTHLTNMASDKAATGNNVVSKTVDQMNNIQHTVSETAEEVYSLGNKIKQIDDIIGLITDIAGQTNLLALNAAIEAARAGENGRGFAVVADEVRKLAEQSANSAGQIRNLVMEVQTAAKNAMESMNDGKAVVEEGISMVRLTGETFQDIVESIERVSSEALDVSSIVEQVNASSGAMVKMAENVAKLAEQSAGNTQNVAAAAEEQNASMEEVSASAEALSKMATELQTVIGKFKV